MFGGSPTILDTSLFASANIYPPCLPMAIRLMFLYSICAGNSYRSTQPWQRRDEVDCSNSVVPDSIRKCIASLGYPLKWTGYSSTYCGLGAPLTSAYSSRRASRFPTQIGFMDGAFNAKRALSRTVHALVVPRQLLWGRPEGRGIRKQNRLAV